jgi:alpha-tubulin suppressor-like RCC1 family protein
LFRAERAAEAPQLRELAEQELVLLVRARAQHGARSVAHPIVPVVKEHGEMPFLVLSLAEGPSLAELIAATAPLSQGEIRRIGGGVAAGLAAIHAAHGLHGALAPSGIALRGPLDPVLSDVGLQAAMHDLQRATDEARWEAEEDDGIAPLYAPPEQLCREQVLPASDVYRLGLILHEMLTGHVPLAGRTRAETLEIRSHLAPLEPRSGGQALPGDVAVLVLRCLEPDPERRPSAAEVARELGAGSRRWSTLAPAAGLAAAIAAIALFIAAPCHRPEATEREPTIVAPAPTLSDLRAAGRQLRLPARAKGDPPPGAAHSGATITFPNPPATVSTRGVEHSGATIAFPNPPAKVSTVGPVKRIASGRIVATIDADGRLWAWDPDAGSRMSRGQPPYRVNVAASPAKLVGGANSPLLLGADGTLSSWSQKGQEPVTVPGLSNVVAAASGSHCIVAIHRDGTVSLVDRYYSLNPPPEPVQVQGLTNAIAVAANNREGVALLRGGEVWSWGYQTSKLAFGPTLEVSPPKTTITRLRLVGSMPNVVALAIRDDDVLVLDGDGVVHHANGNGSWRKIDGLPLIVSISAFSDAAAALDASGGVWTWGKFGFGREQEIRVPRPAKVEGLPPIAEVNVDTRQSVAIDRQGGLWVWGPTTDCDQGHGVGLASCN